MANRGEEHVLLGECMVQPRIVAATLYLITCLVRQTEDYACRHDARDAVHYTYKIRVPYLLRTETRAVWLVQMVELTSVG